MTAALAGLGSGAIHALSGPDHLLGVAPHALRRGRGAWRVGLAWGIGHAAGTLAAWVALLTAAAAVRFEEIERWAERGAGLALVAVGVLGLLALRRARLNPASAAPAAAGLAPFVAVGAVHGATGAAALVLVVLGAASPGLERLVYMAGFSAGSTAAMVALAMALARAAGSPRLAAALPKVSPIAAGASIAIGLGWLALA
jgi:nickel/cobalt transporter (NicO) family protein